MGGEMKKYSPKEIEDLLWLPCCHVTGMHDPIHFELSKYICSRQKALALERLCKKIGINPKTKSDPECYWCKKYPEKKNGEGMSLFTEEGKGYDNKT